mgnify:CR=1 FL=1
MMKEINIPIVEFQVISFLRMIFQNTKINRRICRQNFGAKIQIFIHLQKDFNDTFWRENSYETFFNYIHEKIAVKFIALKVLMNSRFVCSCFEVQSQIVYIQEFFFHLKIK